MDSLELFALRLNRITGSDAQDSLHASFACCLQLIHHVRNKNNRFSLKVELVSDATITPGLHLAADARIEVGIDQIRMITRSCVCEQKLLSENASGREDGDLKVVCT